MTDANNIGAFLFGIVLGMALLLLFVLFTDTHPSHYWHKEIVEHNCGHYDSGGNFKWKEESKKVWL